MGMRMKDFNLPLKIHRNLRTSRREVLIATEGFTARCEHPNEVQGVSSYTALQQTLNIFCEQEGQALSIIKTLT